MKKVHAIDFDRLPILVHYLNNGQWTFNILTGITLAHKFYSHLIRHNIKSHYGYWDGEKVIVTR